MNHLRLSHCTFHSSCLPFLLLLFSLTPFLPRAQAAVNPADLEALKQLFQKDPATAFEKSWKLFQEPRKEGDLEGMMEIFDVAVIAVHFGSRQTQTQHPVIEDMIDAAVPVARRQGNWEALGNLYLVRGFMLSLNGRGPALPCSFRGLKFIPLAVEAYEKAGKPSSRYAWLLEKCTRELTRLRRDVSEAKDTITGEVGTNYAPLVLSIYEAIGEARDTEAVSGMQALLEQIATETNTRVLSAVLSVVAEMLWVRGAERCIPLVRELAEKRNTGSGVFSNAYYACLTGWSGRSDLVWDTIYWALRGLVKSGYTNPPYAFAGVLKPFHRDRECERLARVWAAMLRSSWGEMEKRCSLPYHNILITASTSSDVRRTLVRADCEAPVWSEGAGGTKLLGRSGILANLRLLPNSAPQGQQQQWASEVGMALLRAAPRYPKPEWRAAGLNEAANLFEQAGRKDLADKARALATALAQNDPKALFACALTAAQSAANESRWQDVEKQLEPALANPPETNKSLLDATLLLERAKRNLGKTAEAESWLSKEKTLVGQVGLSAGERVNYLMTFANGASDKAEKTRLLEQAKQAAAEAGLDQMQESINQQLAELTLQTGDLGSAKRALLDIVNKQEAKRERLALILCFASNGSPTTCPAIANS